MNDTEKNARLIRLIAIHGYLDTGAITKEEAVELLKGPLTPGKEDTIRDDSRFVDSTPDEVLAFFYPENAE